MSLELIKYCLSGDTADADSDTENASETQPDTGDNTGDSGAELIETCLEAEKVPPTLTEVYTE